MTKPMFVKYPLKITTLSPVHIGDAKERSLSPYSDYFMSEDGQWIKYIDERKLLTSLKQQNKLEQYLKELREKQDNNRSDFSLRAFLLGEMGLSETEIVKFQVSNIGIGENDRQEIAATSKIQGKAYLPGSSLKGALRTAMLYDWLVSSKAGSTVLKSTFRQIQKLADLQDQMAEVKRRARGYREEKQGMRGLIREEKRMMRYIFPEDELFGSIIDNNDANRIRVSDSDPLSERALQITAAQRIRLRPANPNPRYKKRYNASDIPQSREVIAAGQELHTELSLLPPLRSKVLQYLLEGKEKVIECLGRFAEECIHNELYYLGQASGFGGQVGERADRLITFYEDLKERTERGEWLLRIGAGKTVYDNSLLLALLYGDPKQKEEETYFRQLREVLFKVPESYDLFPVTRTLTADGKPMGWVRIEIG